MADLFIALVLGVLFGFALNKAGLTRYHKIVNVFRFTDMAVLQFMMTALVVSMIGLYGLRGLGFHVGPTEVPRRAERGLAGPAGGLPHGDAIQRSFGRHDLGGVQAHVGGEAQRASAAIGEERNRAPRALR